MFDRIFGQSSARVVAIARLALALVFLAATVNGPAISRSVASDGLLAGYALFAVVILWIAWKDWWADAKIAAATHIADILFFMMLVVWPEGYASPYFLFFVFLLLSASIRWGWRATLLTALAVIGLYVAAGLLVGSSADTGFELQRFIIRTGYLFVVSALLIWFGVRRGFTGGRLPADRLLDIHASDASPFPTGLRQSADLLGAECGLVVWTDAAGRRDAICSLGGGLAHLSPLEPGPPLSDHAFLFDTAKDRALVSGGAGLRRFRQASMMIDHGILAEIPSAQGVAIPVRSHLGQGLFLFWSIRQLHSDHLELGNQLAAQLTILIDRHALLLADQEAAIARERLRLARDLHDGVVQFLAASTYKVEAIRRSVQEQRDVSAELHELKEVMLAEQQDMRSSITALRGDDIRLPDIEDEARSLCERLGRQWQIDCNFEGDVGEVAVSARLHFDILHIIREGIANAVRHSSAKEIDVRLSGQAGLIELAIVSDGASEEEDSGAGPWSIRERVEEADGTVSIGSDGEGSQLIVQLPVRKEPP